MFQSFRPARRRRDFKVSEFQSFKVSGLPAKGGVAKFKSFKVSRFQSFKVSKFQSFKVSKFQSSRIAGLQGCRIKGSGVQNEKYLISNF
ncbi:MAG: hypothetical protein FD166_2995 [Bacteroidetes bacterium]|nr:MAG: hypothetical protein FD166_2995 [Bacteroidota bacterium]